MKFTKFMVLIAGVAAIISFFLPLVAVREKGIYVHVSAFQLVKGVDKVSDVADIEGNAEMDKAIAEKSSEVSDTPAAGYAMLIFGPVFLLAVIGGIGIARKRFGRLAGAGALILGGWGTLMGAALVSVASKHENMGDAGAGAGIYLYLVAGILGLVAGLLTLIKPDRGEYP